MKTLGLAISILLTMVSTQLHAHAWQPSMSCSKSPDELLAKGYKANSIFYALSPSGRCWHVHSKDTPKTTKISQRLRSSTISQEKNSEIWPATSLRFPQETKGAWWNAMARGGWFTMLPNERAKWMWWPDGSHMQPNCADVPQPLHIRLGRQ